MLRKFVWLVVIVALVLPYAAPSFAQERPADALIIGVNSGLWLSNEQGAGLAPTDLPENADFDFFGPLKLSPTGRYVAFQSVIPNFPGGSGPAPTSLYLLDLNTNAIIPVYEQGAFSDDAVNRIDISNIVAWSPDGTRLAFLTHRTTAEFAELHIFDVATGTTAVVNPEMPISFGIPFAPDVAFTSRGVVTIITLFDGTTSDEVLHIYDPTSGAEVLTASFAEAGLAPEAPVEFFVAQRGDEEILVISLLSSIRLFNLSSQQFEDFVGVLQLMVRDNGIKLNYLPLGAQGAIWEAETPDGARFALPYDGLWLQHGIAISATGQTIAYVSDGIQLWSTAGVVGSVAVPTTEPATRFNSSLVWGPERWQIIEGGYG